MWNADQRTAHGDRGSATGAEYSFQEIADSLREPLGIPLKSRKRKASSKKPGRKPGRKSAPAGESLEEKLEAKLEEARRSTDSKDERIKSLESIYRQAVESGFHGTAQRALEAMQALKNEARSAQNEERMSLIRARLEAGRYGSVIALTGGARPDEGLPVEGLLHRVRALAALDGLTRARREFGRLRFLAREDDAAVPLLIAWFATAISFPPPPQVESSPPEAAIGNRADALMARLRPVAATPSGGGDSPLAPSRQSPPL